MDASLSQKMELFSGVNNVDPRTRLLPRRTDYGFVHPIAQGNNVIIDNSMCIESRSGYAEVLAGTSIHSMWSDGTTCFYVDGESLYSMSVGYEATEIRSGLKPNARMVYAPFNSRIYYSNGYQNGYVESGVNNGLPDPDREFKEPLPAGEHVAVFMACLYVSKGNILYISDPLCDYYDIRNGYRMFAGYISMVRPVDNGVYVSDAKVWFMRGKGNEDFERDEVAPARCIEYTDINVPGKYLDPAVEGTVAIWTSEAGVCLGDRNGGVVNITEARYTYSPYGSGAAFLRESGANRHYINTLY